jgi:hypothetical protein
MMKSLVLSLLLLGTLTTPVLAQEEGDKTPAPIIVAVGNNQYAIDGNQPLTGCITERIESTTGIYVDILVFARQEDGTIRVMGEVDNTRATAAVADAHVDDCFVLTAEVTS